MNAREARAEFQAGRLPSEQLLDLLERQERLIQRLHSEVEVPLTIEVVPQ